MAPSSVWYCARLQRVGSTISSAETPHRVPVSEGMVRVNPAATAIDSSQQCHSAKQTASIPETTWYVQQQLGVADYN